MSTESCVTRLIKIGKCLTQQTAVGIRCYKCSCRLMSAVMKALCRCRSLVRNKTKPTGTLERRESDETSEFHVAAVLSADIVVPPEAPP